MLHRCFEHLLLSSGNFEGAIFLARIISAIDRFSIRHVSLLLLFGFPSIRQQKNFITPCEIRVGSNHVSRFCYASKRGVTPPHSKAPKAFGAKKPC
jgi:hypothetical protein